MSNWTKEEMRQLVDAIMTNNHEKVTHFMNLYQQRTNVQILKDNHHIFITAFEGVPRLFEYYVKTQQVDNDTLFNCLDLAVSQGHLPFVKAFFANPYINFDPNYTLLGNRSILLDNKDRHLEQSILFHALNYANIKEGQDEILRFILQKVNVNRMFHTSASPNLNALFFAIICGFKPSLIKLLLDNGVDPYQEVNLNGTQYNIFDFLRSNEKHKWSLITHAAEYTSILKEWKENKEKGLLKRDSSPEHSSGSGSHSPMSVGTPEGSPPQRSPMIQGTPPDSPAVSRNGSPPGSPMHTSDNSSSGSAGTSPSSSSDTKPKIVLKVDKSLPKDKFEKRFYTRISPDTPIEQLKEYYFSGVTLDWYAPDHGGNAFHRAAEFRSNFPVAEAMLEWGVDINIKDLYGRTTVQRLAISEFAQWLSLECLEFVFKDRPHIKTRPDIDYQDRDGNTALHLAAAKGADEIVDWLLKHGANARLTNGAGLTAEQYADKCENLEKRTIIKTKLRPYSVQQSQSVMRSPAEIQYRSQPASSSSYANSSSVMFPNNSASNKAPVPVPLPPPTRSAPQTVGALYGSPPPSTLQLPRQPESSPASASTAKKSSSVTGILKKVFGK